MSKDKVTLWPTQAHEFHKDGNLSFTVYSFVLSFKAKPHQAS
jgi:hypothetical protein